MAATSCELYPEISNQLSVVLKALESYEYTELELIPFTWSDNTNDLLVCELKEDTLMIQGTPLRIIYMEAQQIFSRFRQNLKRGSFSWDWKLWDSLSRFLLFVQPAQSTVWNFRKCLLLQSHVSYDLELEVNRMALKRNAKTSEVWQHRKWILLQQTNSISSDFIERELEMCSFLVDRFEKSYHLWYYRWWLVDSYISILPREFIIQEYYKKSKEAIRQHVSDHGAYFYRQKLLLYLLKNQNTQVDYFALLSSEWEWTHSIIEMIDYSFDSPFSYAQFIYACCSYWLDYENSQHRYLMDAVYQTLKCRKSKNRQDDKVSSNMLFKMSRQLFQVVKIIIHDDMHHRTITK
ncbi:protein prenyltransferase [Galdieria sulphuraria]|uniref:Protein prenyltransferase n=1 Tax=Galdieria sulphuraria TaxID=130081 RepID=M2VZ44_GALSU|nr:protein prenyltransferase [Galdieria sulphuraria]EME28591.1 protein prenyltransferase [Galdieria sulphuraria]|eukprot:XP_005705111.1 protein prenyltransferase [Galdieria sulphuraria]